MLYCAIKALLLLKHNDDNIGGVIYGAKADMNDKYDAIVDICNTFESENAVFYRARSAHSARTMRISITINFLRTL